jgi:hypothetical protein
MLVGHGSLALVSISIISDDFGCRVGDSEFFESDLHEFR